MHAGVDPVPLHQLDSKGRKPCCMQAPNAHDDDDKAVGSAILLVYRLNV